MTSPPLDEWDRVVLRATCETLSSTIAAGGRVPNLAAAGIRLMLAGFTSLEIELFKAYAERALAALSPPPPGVPTP